MTAKKWIIIVLLCVGITACDPSPGATDLPTDTAGQIQAWIDAPLPNSTIPMLPYKLVFHGASYVGINEFELRVNGAFFATVPPSSTGSGGGNNGTLFYGETLWTPPAPGTYLIEVIAKGNGQVSSPDQVYVTVVGDGDELVTPSPTEGGEGCRYKALVNLNCRLGPGLYYIAVGFFLPEQSAPVVGKTTDGFYWYVIAPNTGNVCTVPNNTEYGIVEGDCREQPMFTPVPLPSSPTPTPTRTPQEGCTVRQSGGEIICKSPCPVGALPGEACTIP